MNSNQTEKTQHFLFENINKMGKHLPRLIKEKKEKNNTEYVERDIITEEAENER